MSGGTAVREPGCGQGRVGRHRTNAQSLLDCFRYYSLFHAAALTMMSNGIKLFEHDGFGYRTFVDKYNDAKAMHGAPEKLIAELAAWSEKLRARASSS